MMAILADVRVSVFVLLCFIGVIINAHSHHSHHSHHSRDSPSAPLQLNPDDLDCLCPKADKIRIYLKGCVNSQVVGYAYKKNCYRYLDLTTTCATNDHNYLKIGDNQNKQGDFDFQGFIDERYLSLCDCSLKKCKPLRGKPGAPADAVQPDKVPTSKGC